MGFQRWKGYTYTFYQFKGTLRQLYFFLIWNICMHGEEQAHKIKKEIKYLSALLNELQFKSLRW